MARIVLDPGHGGRSPAGLSTPYGARGAGGAVEGPLMLALAQRVNAMLGQTATLTRRGDQNLMLRDRAAASRNAAADVFVSLHASASGRRGSETWVHSSASPQSRALAGSIQREVARLGGRDGGVRAGQLAVLAPELHAPQTAACMLEADWLGDRAAEELLGRADGLDRLARAVATGIERYGRPEARAQNFVSDALVGPLFGALVAASRATGTAFTPPPDFEAELRDYAAYDTTNGPRLLAALARGPSFYRGGVILDIQTAASAITLDTTIFFRDTLAVSTYIHELIHVHQYGALGIGDFVLGYFGTSAIEVIKQLLDGRPVSLMDASPLETDAYGVESQFRAWATSNSRALAV